VLVYQGLRRGNEEKTGQYLRRATQTEDDNDVSARHPAAIAASAHTSFLVDQLRKLEDRLRAGGGADKIEKQHRAGKLTARERLEKLLDPGAYFQEIGLLIAYDRYDGHAPAAGVVTGAWWLRTTPP
jgi:hypothetical protein